MLESDFLWMRRGDGLPTGARSVRVAVRDLLPTWIERATEGAVMYALELHVDRSGRHSRQGRQSRGLAGGRQQLHQRHRAVRRPRDGADMKVGFTSSVASVHGCKQRTPAGIGQHSSALAGKLR